VKYVPSTGYITQILRKQIRNPSSARESRPTDVFRALAKLPWAENHVRVFFKIFHPRNQNTAVFNELFFFRAAQAWPLPVPRDVCLCPARRSSIIGPSRCLEDRDPDSEWIGGIASVDASPHGLLHLNTKLIPQLVADELRFWKFLVDLAVFDEIILNVDRTPHNLYRVGKQNYLLIDHAEALGGQGWDLSSLENKLKKPSNANYIAAFIAEETDAQTQNAMMAKSVDCAKNFRFTESLIKEDFVKLDQLCRLNPGTTKIIAEMLNERVSKLPELMFHHLRLAQFNLQ
jgi:hypothetical protein